MTHVIVTCRSGYDHRHSQTGEAQMGLRGPIAAACAAMAISGAPAYAADAPSFVTTRNCDEHQAFVEGDTAGVAARLPARYTPVIDPPSGEPIVFVRALRCAALTSAG